MKEYYSLDLIFFSFNDNLIDRGTLEYSTEPNVMAKASTEDRNFPIPSFRDPRTVVHIFDLEISKGSLDYKLLTRLSNEQFYGNLPKAKKLKRLVFNDQMGLKIISNSAFFAEIPTRKYSSDNDTVKFTIHAINCDVEKASWVNN